MKLLSITTAIFATLFLAGIAVSFAEAAVKGGPGVNFIDEDGDGICDNAGANGKGNAGDTPGNGDCDGTQKRIRDGSNGDGATGDTVKTRTRTRSTDGSGTKTRRNIRRGRS
jgi:hypothetical protein